MSLSAITVSPSQAANYYFREDHTLGSGQWWGLGAAALGLAGNVMVNDFRNVLHGYSGDRSQRLRQQRKSHLKKPAHGRKIQTTERAGTDLTFSAPKSVSIAALVNEDQRVIAAHQAAVITVLETIQDKHLGVREQVSGKQATLKSDNLIAAMFLHNTSRNLDPQLHTHALVMNATMDSQRKWKSMVNTGYFKKQPELGKQYRKVLAENLQQIGYQPVWDEQQQFFELAEISPRLIEAFSTRRAEVVKAAKGTSIKQRKWATLETRKPKADDVDEQALIASWKQRAAKLMVDDPKPQAVAELTPTQRKKKRYIQPIANPNQKKGLRR